MDSPGKGEYLVSVVVPAFNAERHISTSLESLCRQTLAGFEVIVVNDGSADKTASAAEAILSASPLSYRVLSQSNQGVSAARNLGLDAARGKYVMFLDSDDYLDPSCLSKLAATAESNQSDIVFCGCDFVSETGEMLRPYSSRHGYLGEATAGPDVLCDVFTERVGVWPGSMIFRKEFLATHDVRFTKGRVIAEDLEFEFKALFHASRVSSVNESLFYYVQITGSVTGTVDLLTRFQGMDVLFTLLEYFVECNQVHKQQHQADLQARAQADTDVGGAFLRSILESEARAIECLRTYMIPVSLAGTFGSLAADGYPSNKLREILVRRSDFRRALSQFTPVAEANLAFRRKLQVQLLRYMPFAYFIACRIRGRLRV